MSGECICGADVPCDRTCAKHGEVLHGYPCGACGREWEAANPRTARAISRIASGKGSHGAFIAAKRADAATHPGQCNHWNNSTGSVPLRPIRCRGEMGHSGRHHCGDTAWDEALGFRADYPTHPEHPTTDPTEET